MTPQAPGPLPQPPEMLATSATGPHPFPSRTRSLSLSASMVLRSRGRGRVDRCQRLLQMSNVQYRTMNFEIHYWTLDILHFPEAVRTLATTIATSSLHSSLTATT